MAVHRNCDRNRAVGLIRGALEPSITCFSSASVAFWRLGGARRFRATVASDPPAPRHSCPLLGGFDRENSPPVELLVTAIDLGKGRP